VQQLYGEETDDERKAMLEFDHLCDWCTSGFSKHQCEQKLMKIDVHTAWNELFLLPAGIDKLFYVIVPLMCVTGVAPLCKGSWSEVTLQLSTLRNRLSRNAE